MSSESQVDVVKEARDLLTSSDRSIRGGYALELVSRLCDELETERQLRQNLKQVARTAIQEIGSSGAALTQTLLVDYRSRILEAIKTKADGWTSKNTGEGGHSDTVWSSMAAAAREILKEIERMK